MKEEEKKGEGLIKEGGRREGWKWMRRRKRKEEGLGKVKGEGLIKGGGRREG